MAGRDPLFPPPLAEAASRNPPPGLLPMLALGDEAWTAEAAVQIADAWARVARGAILTDLALEQPRLHELLELPNAEGIVDVFLFGTSLAHATQQPQDRAFRFVPAGLFAPDAREVVEHAKWERLGHEAMASRTTLLVFVTDRTPGFETLLRRAGQAIVLIGAGAPIAASPVPKGCEALGVVRQPRSGAEPSRGARDRRDDAVRQASAVPGKPGPAEPAEPPRPIELSDEAVEPHEPSPAALKPLPPVIAPILREQWLEEPPPLGRRERRQRRVWPIAAVVMLAAAGGVVGLWVFQPWQADAAVHVADARSAELEPAPPPEPPPSPEARDVPVPYSVAVEAHQTLAAAQARARVLRAAEPGVVFAVAPTPLDDLVWFRIVAGPAADSMGAEALMRQLYSRGHKTSQDPWAIRRTLWAFHIDDFTALREAEERVARLEDQAIPAYVVEMPFSEGPSRYRVYAGAFEGLTEADYMRELLQRAGIRPSLIRRTGRPYE